MNIKLSIFMLCIAAAALAQDWETIDLGTDVDLLAIENTSFSSKWVVGAGGFAAQSDASRLVWTPVDVETTADLLSIIQSALGQVWVGAGSGSVRIKINENWFIRDVPNSSQDFSLSTRGSGTAKAVGTAGAIYQTVNMGVDWDLVYSGAVPLRDGKGAVTSLSWAVGDEGTILKTTDGGVNWEHLASGTSADIHAFLEGGSSSYFAVGEHGTILKSTDAGLTWVPKDSGTNQTLRAISSSKQNSAWVVVVGDNGVVLKSTNNGENWCHLDAGTSADLFGVEAVLNAEYILCGEGGLMLRTTTGGGDCLPVAVEDLPRSSAASLELYPNPMQSEGRILFEAAREGRFEMDVFDVGGRHVSHILSGDLQVGDQRRHELDTRSWPAGVYFLRLKLGESVVTRRFTVIR